MQTLVALLVAAVAACAIARPPGPRAAPAPLQAQVGAHKMLPPPSPPRDYLGEYLLPRFLLPHYLGYEESPRIPIQLPPENDWLNKEIDRINQMDEDEEFLNPYEVDDGRWISQDPYMQRIMEGPLSVREPLYAPESIRTSFQDLKPMKLLASEPVLPLVRSYSHDVKRDPPGHVAFAKNPLDEHRKMFALTPLDKEYYEHNAKKVQRPAIKQGSAAVHHEGGAPRDHVLVLEPPRQIRQNPNLSKQKNLLQSDFAELKTGLSGDDDDGRENKVQVLESAGESIYALALIAAAGAALTMALVGFAFGIYTLSKKAKAAADVDYPAYGVTGPTMDSSGDRKLAHSAHMYHYQHQKQQIIAMERNGMDQRAGSVSDPESEEENEEGDYTVYECPGFATTGDMEVKNPLFSEDPTPTTPGKCEVVKPQPKE